jgi:hypothetical protein
MTKKEKIKHVFDTKKNEVFMALLRHSKDEKLKDSILQYLKANNQVVNLN